uniref:Nucelotide kinase n=1 Tax=Dulem virus 42 TaxID=3145760 RepID=A0AAU8B844_9CAUD
MLQQFGTESVKDFCLINAFKYLFRCKQKHSTPIDDLWKAMWYINKYLEIQG